MSDAMSDAMSDDTAGSEREPDEREPVDRDDDHDDEVAGQPLRVDPDAPGRSLFEDGDAVEPNEPA
jgi:hypothetical protein